VIGLYFIRHINFNSNELVEGSLRA
jgi:hypothetical protein